MKEESKTFHIYDTAGLSEFALLMEEARTLARYTALGDVVSFDAGLFPGFTRTYRPIHVLVRQCTLPERTKPRK